MFGAEDICNILGRADRGDKTGSRNQKKKNANQKQISKAFFETHIGLCSGADILSFGKQAKVLVLLFLGSEREKKNTRINFREIQFTAVRMCGLCVYVCVFISE